MNGCNKRSCVRQCVKICVKSEVTVFELKGDGHPITKENYEMVENYAPVTDGHRPFFGDIYRCQIENLHQGVVGNEGAFCLCHFAQLAVEIPDGVGGVNQRPDFGRIFEHGGKLRPVDPPALDAKGIFAAPFGLQLIQRRQGNSSVAAL